MIWFVWDFWRVTSDVARTRIFKELMLIMSHRCIFHTPTDTADPGENGSAKTMHSKKTEATHDHARHHHNHAINHTADVRWVALALLCLSLFCILETLIGWMISSVALLSDAAHMFSDVLALVLAIGAIFLANKTGKEHYTYGYSRYEILSAQLNGWILIIMAVITFQQGITRCLHPLATQGRYMVYTSIAGIIINLITAHFLRNADRQSLNVEGAYQHILTDLLGFIFTLCAGIMIEFLHWNYADAGACLAISLFMLYSGVNLVYHSNRILLEAAPSHISVTELHQDLEQQAGIQEVHDLHIWQINSTTTSLSTHIVVKPQYSPQQVRLAAEAFLHTKYGIEHTAIQIEEFTHDPTHT